MEAKVSRVDVSIGPNSVKWSDDGIVALATATGIVLHAPDFSDGKLKWARIDSTSLETIASIWDQLESTADGFFSVGGSGIQNRATDLHWSPTGLSETRGCFLAYITSKHEVHLFHSMGDPIKGKWTLRLNLSAQLVDDISPDWEAPKNFKQLSINAIAWSKAHHTKGSWGHSYLAVGTLSNDIYVYSVGDDTIKLQGSIPGSNSDPFPISVAWMGDDLVVGYSDNSLKLVKLTIGSKFAVKSTITILPPSRFLLSYQQEISDGWIACRTGTITKFSKNGDIISTTKIPFNTIVTGVLDTPASTAVVSRDGDMYSTNDAERSQGLQILNRLLSRVKTEETQVKVFGLAAHPCGSNFVLVYSVHSTGSWPYPIPSRENVRLAFIGLQDGFDFRPYPAISGSSDSFLEEARLAELRGTDIQAILSELKPIAPSKPKIQSTLSQTLETFFKDSSLDNIRAQIVFGVAGAEDVARQAIANTVLDHFKSDNDALTDIDRAILLSYSTFSTDIKFEGSGNTVIDVAGDGFTEQFDFKDQTDPKVLVSLGGRKWKRCSITLLPILSLDSLATSTPGFAVLDRRYFRKELSQVGTDLLECADFSIYTGTKWFSRK